MPSHKREADDLRALCAQIYSDDGVDPRYDKKCVFDRTRKHDRKLQQLCKQVATALQLVLPNVQALAEARVSSVLPAPNAGRLRVVVAVSDTCDHRQVVAQLERCGGYLRSEVALMVSRRRVPDLVYSVVMEDISNG